MQHLDATTKQNIQTWLDGFYDDTTKETIRDLIQNESPTLIDAFYTHLKFGTGGLRGIMGVGTNRMNRYTVCFATQGLANYLQKQTDREEHSVFISYDSRHQSRFFAEEAARVLAGNGIRVSLTKELRPTPLVSFGCRFYHCSAAIMITASHNPPEYNGYKVYWNDGGQVIAPHDKGIVAEAEKIADFSKVRQVDTLDSPLIEEVGEEVDLAYYDAIEKQQLLPKQNHEFGHKLKIVYTSLHGTGITLIEEGLNRWGFTDLHYVKEQVIPDGDFPYAHSPNPEQRDALEMGIEVLIKEKADILIATDPDADRMGIAILDGDEVIVFNGNQIAALLTDHICRHIKIPERGAVVKSIVTTELIQSICDAKKIRVFNVLPGFKYIAEKIREWESSDSGYRFIFGCEESYGYLIGTQTRDKDAIIAAALICEAALSMKLKNKTLSDSLQSLSQRYGSFIETQKALKFPDTKEGKERIRLGMETLRNNMPKTIFGTQVLEVIDYLGATELPRANVLIFHLEDQTKLVIRPSGTEPKIKIYCGTVKLSTEQNLAYLEAMSQLL